MNWKNRSAKWKDACSMRYVVKSNYKLLIPVHQDSFFSCSRLVSFILRSLFAGKSSLFWRPQLRSLLFACSDRVNVLWKHVIQNIKKKPDTQKTISPEWTWHLSSACFIHVLVLLNLWSRLLSEKNWKSDRKLVFNKLNASVQVKTNLRSDFQYKHRDLYIIIPCDDNRYSLVDFRADNLKKNSWLVLI